MSTSAVEAFNALEPEFRLIIMELLRFHAYCERGAAQLFGYGIQFVPDIKTLKFLSWHITEETRHYALVANLFETHTGTSLEPWVMNRLRVRPLPRINSLVDLGIAQWLFDLSGNKQIEGYESCSWEPYRTILEQILKDERGHQEHGREIALAACRSAKETDRAQETFNVWLRQALLCFGLPNSPRDAYAVSVGIKKRSALEVINGFLEEIRPGVAEAGLKFPDPAELQMEIGDGIRWPV